MSAYTLRPDQPDWPVARIRRGASYTIGRSMENALTLRHASISRRHAVAEAGAHGLAVRDLDSLNGTYVNGERIIAPTPLHDRDTVQFGNIRFTVEADAPAAGSDQRVVRQFVPATETFTSMASDLGLTALKTTDVPAPSTDAARLATLLSIANALTGARNEAELGQRILDELQSIITFDCAALLVLDDAGNPLPVVTRPEANQSAISHHVSMTIVQEALRQGEAILTSDATEDPRFHAAQSIMEMSVRSAMCLPLQTPAGQLGVLYFDSRVLAASYTEGDLAYLGAFAAQAAIALSHMQLQRRIRDDAVVQANFSRFFSPNTVQAILERDTPMSLGGEEREVTVLFADIRGYTGLTEQLPLPELVEMLNEYYPQMVDVVFSEDGTLEKYIGDALVAVWGAPLTREDDADRAVRAAVGMQRAIVRLNAWWAKAGRPYTIDVGIGISTGMALAGNIGSERYLQYATIGDATNTASRLCDAARGGEILVAATTAVGMRDAALSLGPVREIRVKGKEAPVAVRTVLHQTSP